MGIWDTKSTEYRKLAASAQGVSVKELKAADLANYFLANGIDSKGQTQMGVIASGGGLAIDAELNVLVAKVGIEASGAVLQQPLLIVQHGPQTLTPELQVPDRPLLHVREEVARQGQRDRQGGLRRRGRILLRQHRGRLRRRHQRLLGRRRRQGELARGLRRRRQRLRRDRRRPQRRGRVLRRRRPAPALLRGDRGGEGGRPRDLGKILDASSVEVALKLEANRLLNRVRKNILESTFDDEKTKKQYGVWDIWTAKDAMFTAPIGTSAEYVERLKKVASWHNDPPKLTALFGSYYESKLVRWEAESLLDRFAPFVNSALRPSSWLRMWSVKAGAGLHVAAAAEASAKGLVAKLEAAVSTKLGAGNAEYKRAGVLWQTRHASTNGILLCTQDTAITYADLSISALEAGYSAEILVANKQKKSDDAAVVAHGALSLMRYESAILYWKKSDPTPVPSLPGTGVVFGQSCVVKNILKATAKMLATKESPVFTKWVLRLAARLNVRPMDVALFLTDPTVQAILTDLKMSSQDKDSKHPWENRAVLVEAGFYVPPTSVAVKDGVPQDLRKHLLTHFRTAGGALQLIRLRYRIADFSQKEKSWRLGFKIAGTGVGITLKSIEEAGSEGIVDLYTRWYIKDEKGAAVSGDAAYNMSWVVPPATLFLQ